MECVYSCFDCLRVVLFDDGDERRAGNASIPKTKSNDSNSNVGFASRCERKDND